MLDLPLPPSPPPPPPTTTSRSPAADKFSSTSETNTSDRSCSFDASLSSSSPPSTDLSQILLNIKSCRWRHFRPRTLPLHELDNAHPLFRKLSRSLKRPLSASAAGGRPYGVQRPARVVPPPAPVAGKWRGGLRTSPVWMLIEPRGDVFRVVLHCARGSLRLPASVLLTLTVQKTVEHVRPHSGECLQESREFYVDTRVETD